MAAVRCSSCGYQVCCSSAVIMSEKHLPQKLTLKDYWMFTQGCAVQLSEWNETIIGIEGSMHVKRLNA